MAATASSAAVATTTSTPSTNTGVEGYEDMFKEITRKLYGEETGHALGTPIPPIAHLATTGPTLPEGERSFTTLMSDRAGNSIDFTNDLNSSGANKDHLFGLAALMQNGFTQPPNSILGTHNFNPSASAGKVTSPNLTNEDASRWNNVMGSSENCGEILPWNVNQPAATSRAGTSKHIKKESEGKRNSQGAAAAAVAAGGTKRYTCSTCPYSTDRRDLYTRHENIHKTEKPFHCYACLKQFNRADHVKKHFLRMHRELQYDINKTRRTSVAGRSSSSAAPTVDVSPASASIPAYYNQSQTQQLQSTPSSYSVPPTADHQLVSNATPEISPLLATQHMIHHHTDMPVVQRQAPNGHATVKVKQEKSATGPSSSNSPKKKATERKFVCCYCPWTGADNWGLKRHLNTHTKPYVCMLCDYKAARSERLVTHVYKVHNKKACSKCSYLADDHVQFLAHQSEAHPVDSRARQGATSNSHGTSQQNSVLRAIGNTTNSTTLASANGAVSQTMALFGNGFNHASPDTAWRPGSQKRGAERLFQYMEADGSDPEKDYQKQLQMTALSRSARNTVAQDFHNAGGGVTVSTSTKRKDTKRRPSERAEIASSLLFANKGYQQKFIRDLEEFIVHRLFAGDGASSLEDDPTTLNGLDKSALINTPPPAKRRRCSSSHDKENHRGKMQKKPDNGLSDWLGDRGQINAQMREIFQMVAQHYRDQMQATSNETSSGRPTAKKAGGSLEQIEKILKNNHELTISIRDNRSGCIKYANGDSGLDDEEEEEEEENGKLNGRDVSHARGGGGKASKRKQFVPRKIGPTESRSNFAVWNRIRDKHLSRLMSPKKSCHVCVQHQASLIIPYHSVSSLLLHKIWRHSNKDNVKQCDVCEHKFKQPYQLILHQRLKHKS